MREIQFLELLSLMKLIPQISFRAIQIEVFQTFMSKVELMLQKIFKKNSDEFRLAKRIILWFQKKGE